VLELVPDAIVLSDREGRIVHANGAAEALFGYAPGSLSGRPVETLVPTRYVITYVEERERYFGDPNRPRVETGIEVCCRRRDGSEFPADVSLASIDRPDPLFVVSIRDASVRVEADRARRLRVEVDDEREIAARRVEGLGQLAGGIAHDFNNLLTVVLESASLAQERARDPDVRGLLEEIRVAVGHGIDLTTQLLAFGRPDAARERAADLGAVIAGVETLLRRAIGRGRELDVRVEPGLPLIAAARGQVEQVLLNLVINARDAMPEGGRIAIEARAEGGDALLAVRDQGAGMPADVASRALDPFFSTKAEGTGLGLATVHGIVKRAGGRIDLDSAPGAGTTVTVRFPVAS
jgi:PAS domain S-box-containing protein